MISTLTTRTLRRHSCQCKLVKGIKHNVSRLSIPSFRNHLNNQGWAFESKMFIHGSKQKRYQPSSSRSPPSNNINNQQNPPNLLGDYAWLPSMFGRILAAFGMLHMLSEYGFELVLCEGPSMYPTIHRSGEVILIDKLSPRLHGIQDGCSGADRAQAARKRQEEWLVKINRASAKRGSTTSSAFDLYPWHEPRIPVNDLPSKGAWGRFWNQITSGISVGDVVVVDHPDRPGTVCKRVLGLPGDLVIDAPATMHFERNPYQRKLRPEENRPGLLVIPDGHIWIEGDNTTNSADSRNYGPVPAVMIVGRVLCRIWPLRGSAMLQRGAPPRLPEDVPFSGSTILPAGYEGEEIIKVFGNKFNKKPGQK